MSKRKRKLLACMIGVAVLAASAQAQRVNPLAFDDPQYGWQDNRDPEAPRVSPNAVVGLQIGFARVMVSYGRPALRGRRLENLTPSGQLWRTGADEATTITFSESLLIEGHSVPAGIYALFTIPGKEETTVVLNSVHNQWGTASHVASRDTLRFSVKTMRSSARERLTFSFEEIDTQDFSARLVLRWGTFQISFKIQEP